MRNSSVLASVSFILILSICFAWTTTTRHHHLLTHHPSSSLSNGLDSSRQNDKYRIPSRWIPVLQALPDGYQEYGNEAILKAARLVGAKDENINIQWKGDTIIVTVHGDVYVSDADAEEVDADAEDDEDEEEDEEYASSAEDEILSEDDIVEMPPLSDGAVDVTTLARAINAALDDGEDGIGTRIAENYSIEVTTPGASDVLIPGTIMFQSYRGFDVITTFIDTKAKTESKRKKTVEGQLVERNDEHLIINIKGRMKKIKNEDVIEVRLPKAKKEKKG